MSKGIIIVDVPERCSMCRKLCRTDSGYAYCGHLGFDYHVNDYMKSILIGKLDWCPICLIPEKDKESYPGDEYAEGYKAERNGLIDRLMGR